jgi:predicted nuclease of predicted toxin-antitoxin system
MKFLIDQDVYAATARFLNQLGHDIVTASQLGLAQTDDSALLQECRAEDRIFVTRDRDFGAIVFRHGAHCGVIYLRMLPSTQDTVHAELERVLSLYSEQLFRDSFVVIEPARHRIRKLTPP